MISETRSPESVLTGELASGERLLWSGRPRGGVRLRPQDALLIPFSLVWGGFAIFWVIMAFTMTAKAPQPIRTVFPLFGVPFVLVGLYMILGRFFVDARARSRTIYGVTSERILIVGGFRSARTRSLALRSISEIAMKEHKDGTGTITFGGAPDPAPALPSRGWSRRRRPVLPAFEFVDRPREVQDVVRSAQRSTTPAS